MATEKSRTLKLSILGDVDNLLDSFKKAEKATKTHTEVLQDYAKKAAVAFAAVGAAVGAFATSAVKAALEDQKAQEALANTLRATTKATEEQIAGVDKWISKTSVQIGVTDDQLRPAFERLARSTHDVTEAQKATSLALDLAAASHKPLETVANALGKAYDGNYTALNKLGLGLDQNLLKSKDQNKIMQELTKTYGDFAEKEAETTAKKFERVTIAMQESKEAIGAALLPVVTKLADYLLTTAIPVLDSFVAGLTGNGGLVDGATKGQKQAYEFGQGLKKVIGIVIDLKEEILLLAGVIATVFVVSKISAFVTATVAAIKALIATYNALKASAIIAGVASWFALNPLAGVAAAAIGTAVLAAASKIAAGSDVSISDVSMGNYQMSTGSALGSAGTQGALGGLGGVVTSLGGLASGLGSAASGGGTAGGTSSAKAQGMMDQLQFDVDTLNTLMDIYQNPAKYTDPRYAQGQSPANMYITVNAPIATEDAAKVIVDTITESANRGGAASGLAAKLANLP